MFLGIFNRPLVLPKLDSESVEPLAFNEVPYCSQAQISTILGVQIKPKQECLIVVKTSHLHKTRAEFSSAVSQFPHAFSREAALQGN
jgi:hypothetical protein